jgi:hypothetical protein
VKFSFIVDWAIDDYVIYTQWLERGKEEQERRHVGTRVLWLSGSAVAHPRLAMFSVRPQFMTFSSDDGSRLQFRVSEGHTRPAMMA